MKLRIFFIFGLFLLCCNIVKADKSFIQHKEETIGQKRNVQLSRHFIIAIDGAMPAYTAELQKPSTKEYVEFVLNDYFRFNNKDFLSVVTYQIDLSNPDFNRFAYVSKDIRGKKIAWRKQEKVCFSDFGQWANIVTHQHNSFVGLNKASFQSAAKPYILQAVSPEPRKKSNSKEERSLTDEGITAANETYILMLTDEKVNGIDDNYQLEWNRISKSENSRVKDFEETVFSKLKSINKRFHFEPFKFRNTDKHVFAHISEQPFTLSIYKVCPTTIPSIQSISDIPAQLPFRKVRGGFDLNLDLNAKSIDYSIVKLELKINKKNVCFSSHASSINQFIKRSQLSEGDTVSLKAWTTYIDGYYNGFIFSPYDSDYANSMTFIQTVSLKDDAKILGKIPVYDFMWWFWPHDIQEIVIFWDVTILLLIIIILCFIAYRCFLSVTTYTPQNNAIKIKKCK